MSTDFKRTVRIIRQDGDEPAELELVSTLMLQHMLESDDERRKQKLREAAAGRDGVLAHNSKSGTFEIVDEYAVPQNALLQPVNAANDDDPDKNAFSLVSTQMLQRMLKTDDAQAANEPELDVDPGGGFNPYDNN